MLRKCYPFLTFPLCSVIYCTGIFFSILTFALSGTAQTSSPTPKLNEQHTTASPPAGTGTNPATSVYAESLKRWLEFDALSVSTRYRFIDNNANADTNQMQYQINVRARFKLDRKGKYSVYAGLFTGPTITGGWNNTGWGTGDAQTTPYLKLLYFDAKPAKWVEFQFGGIAPNNGENTEITGYDNDVYLMGERVNIRNPKKLFFDEISVANAFIGDNNTPNVFRRFKRLGDSNYHQFLVRKQLNKRVGFSADYTFEAGRDFLRQAVNIKAPELQVLDHVVFENYQRLDPNPGYGFSLWGDKKVNPRLTLGGGFAHIDRPMLNADRFPPGNRPFVNGSYKLTRELSINVFYNHAVGDVPTPTTPRSRLDLILTFNILEMLHHMKAY